ncbi:hypothetical protein Y032_0688g1545 [Ancylostoma ceylanicum]|uniref:Uncharacterized protein n=2 Tax=Ancylostoma ceylanicum TaxID=53326 RepID=A0A016WGD4_9BILA|nr:hypothetical protein Y032_0688g1545 [Ancylostoma ceylanicum]
MKRKFKKFSSRKVHSIACEPSTSTSDAASSSLRSVESIPEAGECGSSRIQSKHSEEDDLTSIDKRVERRDPADGFRLYTPAITSDGDGFLLVIITPTQEQFLRNHANRGIVIDCISGVSQHNLSLATIVIADRYDCGLPAAFLLSKRVTQSEVALLFEEVRKVAPCFNPRFFMSDSDPAFFNVFKSVFPDSATEMSLCSWPVLQSMKRDLLTKLRNMSLLEETMQHLRKTFKANTTAKFVECYGLTISFLTKNNEVEMVEYLRSNWDNRIAQWTPLVRPKINTWLFCERWLQRLKAVMVGSKRDIRLDVLVDILIDAVAKTWEHFSLTTKTKLLTSGHRLKQQHSNHSKADQAYRQGRVRRIEAKDGEWVVMTKNGVFTVTFLGCDCPEQSYHCQEDNCGACPYAYICDCIEEKGSAEVSCVHVHLACSRDRLAATSTDSNDKGLDPVPREPSNRNVCDTADGPVSSSDENGLQNEAKEPVQQCSTEFNTNIQRLGARPTPREIPVSRLPYVRCPAATRRICVIPRDPAPSRAHTIVMNTQWLIVSTKQHDYSVILVSEVSSGRISCGSLIKTTDGREVTIIFIGSSREQCEQYCRKLTGSAEVKWEDVADGSGPSTSHQESQGSGQPPEGLDRMAVHPVDAVKSDESRATQNGTGCKESPKRCIRVPRSMVLELARTLNGLEDEIRSRFDHLEDLMEETCGRITAIENALKMEETAPNTSSRNYASSNQSEAPSFDSSRPESSLERDYSVCDEASGKEDDIVFVEEVDGELVELIPCDEDEVVCLEDQLLFDFHGGIQSAHNIWTNDDADVFCRKPCYPLTMSERAEIVRLSGGRNFKEIAAEFNRQHQDRRPISARCVSRLLSKVKETGSILDRPRSGRPRRSTTEDNAALIIERFRRCPTMSIRRMAKETGISRGSIHRILIEHNARYGVSSGTP